MAPNSFSNWSSSYLSHHPSFLPLWLSSPALSLTSYSWSVPFPILLKLYVLFRRPSVCLSSAWKSHIRFTIPLLILSRRCSPDRRDPPPEDAHNKQNDKHSSIKKARKSIKVLQWSRFDYLILKTLNKLFITRKRDKEVGLHNQINFSWIKNTKNKQKIHK